MAPSSQELEPPGNPARFTCRAWCGARGSAPQLAMRPPRVRSIASIGSSKRRVRTPCGCPILPMSRHGPVLSMSPSLSTSLRGVSSAGVSPAPLTPASCWTRWSKPCTSAGPSGAAASSITAIAQYLSIKYTERLAAAGIEPSVGSVGDSYDNALAETINGLYKAEVIHRRGPWRSFEAVEFATLEWVDWFNNRRRLEPIGNIPPAEAEAAYYIQLEATARAA